MVQVLPYVQTPLEQLTPHINQAAQSIGQGVGGFFRNRSDQQILNSIQNGEISPASLPTIWGKLSPEARATYEPFLKTQLDLQQHQQKLEQTQAADIKKVEKEKEIAREELAPKFDNLDKLIDDQVLNVGNLEAQEALNAQGFWITDQVYTHFNKGVINKEKFKNMKDDLAPNANLRPAVNKARLKALKTISGLPEDISKEKFDKVLDQSIKKVKEVERHEDKVDKKKGASKKSEKTLTDDLALEILKEAGNDPNEARRIAKERGYDF